MTRIFSFKTVSSTNTVAFELAKKGASEGEVVVAKRQTQGRGRLKRKWSSKPGNIYVSFIVRPKISASFVTQMVFVSAIAVSKTLEKYLPMKPKLKWPNDVLVKGKKISGILLESQSEGEKVDVVIVGIGININQKKFPKSLSHAISLYHILRKEINLEEFLNCLLKSFEKWYRLFQQKGFSYIKEIWEKQSMIKGQSIEIKDNKRKIQGVALGLDDKGALVIQTSQRRIHSIYSGDLVRMGSHYFWH